MDVRDVDARLVERLLHRGDVLRANPDEVAPVGICDPPARLKSDVGAAELDEPDRRPWIVEDVLVFLGLLDDDIGRPRDVVVVADAEDELLTKGVVGDRIRDRAVREVPVRNRDLFVIERSHARHPEIDVFDPAGVAVPLDPVADLERLVLQNEDSGDEVAEQVLCGESDRQRDRAAEDGKRGQKRPVSGHREPDGDRRYPDDGVRHARSKTQDGLVEPARPQHSLDPRHEREFSQRQHAAESDEKQNHREQDSSYRSAQPPAAEL